MKTLFKIGDVLVTSVIAVGIIILSGIISIVDILVKYDKKGK